MEVAYSPRNRVKITMTKREIATAAGITTARIEQLKRELLEKGADYDVTTNDNNSSQLIFYDSALEKILARRTQASRPKKQPEAP